MDSGIAATEQFKYASQLISAIAHKKVKYAYTYAPAIPSALSSATLVPSRPFLLPHLKSSAKASVDSMLLSEADPNTVTLHIKQLKSAAPSFPVQLSLMDTVGTLKALVSKLGGIPVEEQRLVFMGKGLTDLKVLADYSIKDGSTITVMKKAASASTPVLSSPEDIKTGGIAGSDSTSFSDVAASKGQDREFWTAIKTLSESHFPAHSKQFLEAFVRFFAALPGNGKDKEEAIVQYAQSILS